MAQSAGSPPQRQRLGRGLAALLGDAPKPHSSSEPPQGVKVVPIEFLRTNQRNPRKTFDEKELDDLVASIKERGIIQPIVARVAADDGNFFEIVAGERRWRAAQKAGLHSVPIIVAQFTDRDALEVSIIENVQRSDLNALEEAQAYSQLAADYGYNHTDIGRVVGKSRSHVANTLRLLALPAHTRELLKSGALTAGHARALLPLPNPDEVADRVISEKMSVRDVESLNDEAADPSSTHSSSTQKPDNHDPNLRDLENRITLALGADTIIKQKNKYTQIQIKISDLTQLNSICEKLLDIAR